MIPSAQSAGKVPAFNMSASCQKTSPNKWRIALVGRFGLGDRLQRQIRLQPASCLQSFQSSRPLFLKHDCLWYFS